jgi:Holliday junction resolvase RusA-like endonuclease
MTTAVTFQVIGDPAPQGSKRAIVNRYTGRAAIVESSRKVKPWRADVREEALRHFPDGPLEGPIDVHLTFRFARPAGHYGKRGLLPSAPIEKVTKPDVDKLARSTLDALTGVSFRDDAQVVILAAVKEFTTESSEWTGCLVEVRAL